MRMLNLQWYNATHSVLLWENNGPMTWDEIYTCQQHLYAMLDTVDHSVDIIVYVESPYLPMSALPNLRRIINTPHPNSGLKIVVKATRVMRAMFTIASKAHPELARNWCFVEDMRQAKVLIDQRHSRVGGA